MKIRASRDAEEEDQRQATTWDIAVVKCVCGGYERECPSAAKGEQDLSLPIQVIEEETIVARESRHGSLSPNTVYCIIAGLPNCGKSCVKLSLLEEYNGRDYENLSVNTPCVPQSSPCNSQSHDTVTPEAGNIWPSIFLETTITTAVHIAKVAVISARARAWGWRRPGGWSCGRDDALRSWFLFRRGTPRPWAERKDAASFLPPKSGIPDDSRLLSSSSGRRSWAPPGIDRGSADRRRFLARPVSLPGGDAPFPRPPSSPRRRPPFT
ncbi:hypothetical protein PR048_004498 [Dryococelus australis]|uniref:Uncharacterized protein n=1 Tax=Dryococelus australis TaxID=614101 RepID=A0ABQ9I6P5_9NEOP|nr:hypothetical protein PR048_004498 [Dryococelus australis]